MSSSDYIEASEYRCAVFQCHESTYRSRAGVDVIPIRVRRWKAYSYFNPITRRYDVGDPTMVGRHGTLKLRFSRERESGDAKTTIERFARFKRVIDRSPHEANKLRDKLKRYVYNHVGVSEAEHPHIVEYIMIFLQRAVPNEVIEVQALDAFYRITEEQLFELQRDDSFYRNKLIPASESFIQDLEEVNSVDDDELGCAICMEMFAHKKKDSSSIIQLPCSHYFHRNCIVPWLHINHLCPTCRRRCNARSS